MSQIQLVFSVTSANRYASIYLGISGTVTVNWGDGNTDSLTQTGGLTHLYSADGSFNVTIEGGSPSSIVSFGDPNTLSGNGTAFNSVTLTSVVSWGNYNITSLAFAFAKTRNLQSVAAIPSTVTNLSGLFYQAVDANLDLSSWDVRAVTNMSYLLQNATGSNPNVATWTTTNLVNATNIFYQAAAFNQSLANWNVSKVTSLDRAFDGTSLSQANFNSTIQGWATRSVKSGVTLGSVGLTCDNSGLAAYQYLVGSGWTIAMPMILVYSISVPNTTVTYNLNLNTGSSVAISWGDRLNTVYNVNSTSTASFIYLYPGTYTVTISGSMKGFGFATGSAQSNLAGCANLTKVTSMGNLGLTYCNFFGSLNLANIPDAIPYTMTSLYSTFFNCVSVNDSKLSIWDTTNITNLDYTFCNATQLSRPIGNWNTANVTSMQYTFLGASSFNQPVNSWNTAKVTNMQYMFKGASSFNQPVNSWNTANVTNMQYMFNNASAFNQPLDQWNTANVANTQGMFSGASAFNQTIGMWNVAKVANMSAMFQGASVFNQPLDQWNTASATNMSYMFQSATVFNQPLNQFNTANVTDLAAMFQYAPAFDQPLNQWNTANVTATNYMFSGLSSSNKTTFNSDISTWNTSALTNMYAMFQNSVFNRDISKWNVANVVNAPTMFQNNIAFNQNLSRWNTQNMQNISYMFDGASGFNQNISAWNTANVLYIENIFRNATAFNQYLGGWDLTRVVQTVTLSNSGISVDNFSNTLIGWAAKSKYGVTVDATGLRYNWAGYAAYNKLLTAPYNWTINGAASSPIQLTYYYPYSQLQLPVGSRTPAKLYLGINSAVTIDWGDNSSIETVSTTRLASHSYTYESAFTVKIYGQDPSSIYQFGDPSLTAPSNYLTSVNDYGTYFLTSLAGAFSSNTGTLTSIPALPKTVTNISYIFANAQNLNLDLSQWDVSGVTNMSYAFSCASGQLGCYNPNISGWNTKSATTFANMFLYNNAFNQNISGWNTAAVTSMSGTFRGASSFDQNIGGWNVRNVTAMGTMLDNCGMSTANFNSLLAAWYALSTPTVQTGVTLGAQGLVYNGAAAIQGFAGLRSSRNWTINGATSVSSLSQYAGYPFTFTFYQYTPRPTTGKTYSLYDGSTLLASFVAGADSITSAYSFPTTLFTGGNHVLTIKDASDATVYSNTVNISFVCFKEDTKILCLKYDREEYVPIQKLKKGDLVKTRASGYVPVDMIGKTRIYNEGTKERIKDQLYVCKKDKYPEVFEDLCITGAHSILVDELTAKQKQKTRALFENVCVTEGKYRLMACIDDRAVPYEKPGDYNIYHIALANDDPYSNYGVYANGLLVESCSKRFLTELSNMTILK